MSRRGRVAAVVASALWALGGGAGCRRALTPGDGAVEGALWVARCDDAPPSRLPADPVTEPAECPFSLSLRWSYAALNAGGLDLTFSQDRQPLETTDALVLHVRDARDVVPGAALRVGPPTSAGLHADAGFPPDAGLAPTTEPDPEAHATLTLFGRCEAERVVRDLVGTLTLAEVTGGLPASHGHLVGSLALRRVTAVACEGAGLSGTFDFEVDPNASPMLNGGSAGPTLGK